MTKTSAAIERNFVLIDVRHIAVHPDNLRDDYRGIPELAASIAEVGLYQPLIVVPVSEVPDHEFSDQITHVVIDGNRRLLAAQSRADVATLFCDVRSDLASAKLTLTTMTVTTMMRDDLTAREVARSTQRMFDLGMTQAQIARSTGRKPKDVQVAKAAAKLRTDVAISASLSLTDLAAIVEFQDDPAAVASITAAAEDGRVDHALERLRQERDQEAKVAAKRAELRAAGVLVLEQEPDSVNVVPLYKLTGPRGSRVTEKTHADCAGHRAHVDGRYYWSSSSLTITYYCDTAAAGAQVHQLDPKYTSGGKKPAPTDAEKKQRATFLARNKEMAAAELVRRRFIVIVRDVATLGGHQATFALQAVISTDSRYTQWAHNSYHRSKFDSLYQELAGVADPTAWILDQPSVSWSRLLWLQVVTAIEADLPKDIHRPLTEKRGGGTDSYARRAMHQAGRYLAHLQAIGYVPCATEQLLIDAAEAAA